MNAYQFHIQIRQKQNEIPNLNLLKYLWKTLNCYFTRTYVAPWLTLLGHTHTHTHSQHELGVLDLVHFQQLEEEV